VKEISRKELLKKGAVAGAVGAAAVVLAYCKKKPSADQETAQTTDACSDLSNLTQADKDMRTQLKYVDKSEKPDQHCSLCQLFVAPKDGAACGTCTVVKGPINPDGYCSSFVKKA